MSIVKLVENKKSPRKSQNYLAYCEVCKKETNHSSKKGTCRNCASRNTKEKARQTMIERYGVEYYSQTKEYKEKVKQTCLERYGVENYNNPEKTNKHV